MTFTLKSHHDWFRVHSVRKIEDPSGRINRRELVVSLDQYPDDIGLGPNPRRPDPKSQVAKAIRTCLEENGENFHLLNRGITILAKNVEYDNKTERVRLFLDDSDAEQSHFGILDGGNTNEKIKEWRREVIEQGDSEALVKRYVNLQVLVPTNDVEDVEIEQLLNDIKEARNTSVQVKQKSLADARKHFDLVKKVLADQTYYPEVTWREGDKGRIDGLQIVTLLMLCYPAFSKDSPDNEPNGAYGRKEKCLDSFLHYSDTQTDELASWVHVIPDLVKLFDELQFDFPNLYGGRFGKIDEVRIFDEKKYEKGSKKYRKTPGKTDFFGREMKYEYPTGWLYPIFSGFRVLLGRDEKSGIVSWKEDPFVFWKSHGSILCSRLEPHLKQHGNEVRKIASNSLTYSAMKSAVAELYKNDLLKKAGIDF